MAVAAQRARAEHEHPARAGPLADLGQQAALARAGGALDGDQRAGPAPRGPEGGLEPAQLLVASVQTDPCVHGGDSQPRTGPRSSGSHPGPASEIHPEPALSLAPAGVSGARLWPRSGYTSAA